MRTRWLLLLLPFLAVAALLICLARPDPKPVDVSHPLACPVCAAAQQVGLTMEPFRRVRVYRGAHRASVLWPRGQVRPEDLTEIVFDLEPDGLELYDLDEAAFYLSVGDQRHGSAAIPAERLFDQLGLHCDYWGKPTAQFKAAMLSRGVRLPIGAEVAATLTGSTESFRAYLEYRVAGNTPDDDPYRRKLQGPPVRVQREHAEFTAERTRLEAATRNLPPWVRGLLEAQLLHNAEYHFAAHEKAREVLRMVPAEPHAVALIYATYLRSNLETSGQARTFGHQVLEPLQAMRKQAGLACDVDRPVPGP